MSNINYKRYKSCCVCKVRVESKKHLTKVGVKTINRVQTLTTNIVSIDDVICNVCRNKTKILPSFSKATELKDTNQHIQKRKKIENQYNSTCTYLKKKSMASIQTAYSSHKKCFICFRSTHLHQVKIASILHAKMNHGVIIKDKTRCCYRHLDKNGLIRNNEFDKIKTKSLFIPKTLINILEKQEIKPNNINIFEKFKNIDTLENSHCIKITGWSKIDFIRFSEYITSIHETYGRTKEELIALYRFWLRKGIDQESLSYFNENKSQQQISRYLSQIRCAINKDFVPFFLGAEKSRDFFIKHNNVTSRILHNLKKDDLAIVVDGTYTRLEKSANNEFQYSCWSQQKMDLLIKPFVICCTDGYFIDCYGPFQANKNDAVIFDYILQTDIHLRKILIPDKTYIFLDRGFLNIFKKLKYEYKYTPLIPSCKQLEEEDDNESNTKLSKKNQLSTEQTTQTRLVTKCRFIIEKQNGYLKNNSSLDNIRNTQVGHIMIDYRITCAMSNFLHKPCCPDGSNASYIANTIKMKSKSNKNENILEFLIRKHLDTSEMIPIDLNEINDFPIISKKQIIQNITLGTFQVEQSKSYIEDLITYSKVYIYNPPKNKKKSDQLHKDIFNGITKIIGIEINSRHKRSVKNISDINSTDSKFNKITKLSNIIHKK